MQTRNAAQWANCRAASRSLSLSRSLEYFHNFHNFIVIITCSPTIIIIIIIITRKALKNYAACVYAYAWYLKNTKRQYDTK